MTQFGLTVGDSVKLGEVTFKIGGSIIKVPGEAAAVSMIGPRIFIPESMVDSTRLVQRGSRVEYIRYFKFEPGRDIAPIAAGLDSLEDNHGIDNRYDDVEERKEGIGEAVGNLARFLNLVGFVALLLGGIGVASSIHMYIKQKINTASILRCFGASSDQTMSIFLIQAVTLGFAGALAGTLLGLTIQFFLPELFSEFLPVSVDLTISWTAIGLGLDTGTGAALAFALMPLLALRKASPLYTLRTMSGSLTHLLGPKTRWGIYLLVLLTVGIYATLWTEDWQAGSLFTVGMTAAFGLLLLVAKELMAVIKRFFPSH
jgi:putative ABC transport system permease protein